MPLKLRLRKPHGYNGGKSRRDVFFLKLVIAQLELSSISVNLGTNDLEQRLLETCYVRATLRRGDYVYV